MPNLFLKARLWWIGARTALSFRRTETGCPFPEENERRRYGFTVSSPSVGLHFSPTFFHGELRPAGAEETGGGKGILSGGQPFREACPRGSQGFRSSPIPPAPRLSVCEPSKPPIKLQSRPP